MRILLPSEIRQPRIKNHIRAGGTSKDWHKGQELLGGIVTRRILNPTRDWTPFVTDREIQRNANNDDFYDCVTQSQWKSIETLANQQYNVILDESKRWTAIKGGTKQGQGASVNVISECIRTMGGVPESVCPSITDTLAEFYQPIPSEIDSFENFLKGGFTFNHEWMLRKGMFSEASSPEQMWDGLQYSPIPAAVDGEYRFTNDGMLKYGWSGPFIQYTHCVSIVGGVYNQYWLINDSENPHGLMKVEWPYCFGTPKILYLIKKPMLYKKNGDPTIYVKMWNQDLLLPFANGSMPGGDLFKSLFGISDYSQMPRTNVDVLPYPVSLIAITTETLGGNVSLTDFS